MAPKIAIDFSNKKRSFNCLFQQAKSMRFHSRLEVSVRKHMEHVIEFVVSVPVPHPFFKLSKLPLRQFVVAEIISVIIKQQLEV